MRKTLRLIALSALALPLVLAQSGFTSASRGEVQTYIIQFSDQAAMAQETARLRGAGASIKGQFTALLPFLVVDLPSAAAQGLARSPQVVLIEPDATVSITAEQTSATWGLDRSDQRSRPLDGKYAYPDSAGEGVKVYIVDSGVLSTHVDFGSRVVAGATAIDDGRGTNDCNGHGTHVAGTAAGTTYGMAKKATIVPVRVLGCDGSGSLSGVIAGLNWIAGDHKGVPAVANMSLGGGKSDSVNNAVAALHNSGVPVVVAAGNSNADACRYSPASEPLAITVGATQSDDNRANYSNIGKCLDLFAPGTSITSAWIGNNSAIRTISGTSMASPHVAGAAALFLGANPSATPAQVADFILNNATRNVVGNAGRQSPNLLLFSHSSLFTSTPPVTPDPLAVTTSSLADGTVGAPYSEQLVASGGSGTYTWSVTSGSLPVGLTVNSTGLISGTPTTAQTASFSVTVSDGTHSASQALTITISAAAEQTAPAAFSKSSPANGATNINKNSVQLSWATSTGADRYEVCWSTNQNSCSNWTSAGTATAARMPKLPGNTTYYWQVRAINDAGTTVANAGAEWRFTTGR
jgi:subtilisin family serine protease